LDRCRDAVQALDDEETAEQARLDFAGHLSEAAATALARAVSFGRQPRRPVPDGGQTVTVRYRFTVEHPAQVAVSGL
jgi:hypothetical protein